MLTKRSLGLTRKLYIYHPQGKGKTMTEPATPAIEGFNLEKPRPKRFTPTQIDFILKRIACFYTIRQIFEEFDDEFFLSGHDSSRIYNKVRYLSRNQRKCKWAAKIEEYREGFRTRPVRNYPLANRFERLRILQSLVDEACLVRIRRVVWYPIFKNPNGSVTYHRSEIAEPNFQAAYRGIRMFIDELKAAGLYESDNGSPLTAKPEPARSHPEPEEPETPEIQCGEDDAPSESPAANVPSNGARPKAPGENGSGLTRRPASSDTSSTDDETGFSGSSSPDDDPGSLNKSELTTSLLCDSLLSTNSRNEPEQYRGEK